MKVGIKTIEYAIKIGDNWSEYQESNQFNNLAQASNYIVKTKVIDKANNGQESQELSVTTNSTLIEVATVSAGYSTTIDCTNVQNYENLTSNDLYFDCQSITFPKDCSGKLNYSKSYNASSGILTMSRNSISGSGVVSFTGKIYTGEYIQFLSSMQGGYSINFDCSSIENYKGKSIDNFLIDYKWVNVPNAATGTIKFVKSYDSNTGILSISRNSITGNGTITFGVDIYALN